MDFKGKRLSALVLRFVSEHHALRLVSQCLVVFCFFFNWNVIRMAVKAAEADLVKTMPHDVGSLFARSISHFTTICHVFVTASELCLLPLFCSHRFNCDSVLKRSK